MSEKQKIIYQSFLSSCCVRKFICISELAGARKICDVYCEKRKWRVSAYTLAAYQSA